MNHCQNPVICHVVLSSQDLTQYLPLQYEVPQAGHFPAHSSVGPECGAASFLNVMVEQGRVGLLLISLLILNHLSTCMNLPSPVILP